MLNATLHNAHFTGKLSADDFYPCLKRSEKKQSRKQMGHNLKQWALALEDKRRRAHGRRK